MKKGRGLPIGNLTSQIFANFYLNALDNMITNRAGFYYGRYVDDMVVIHSQKHMLLSLISNVKSFLKDRYRLILHPKKTALHHYVKGFPFTGAFLLPNRIYAGHRLKQQLFFKIRKILKFSVANILSVINSYFGFLKHYNTLRLRLYAWNKIKQNYPALFIDKFLMKIF